MSSNNSFASKLRAQLRARPRVRSWWLCVGAVLIALAVVGPSTSVIAKGEAGKHLRVSGAGKTMIEGGTGGAAPVPVTTLVAFHADAQGGDFECLAFASSQVSGAASGEFDANVMYVTGKVTSLEIAKGVAMLRGTATVTDLGAVVNCHRACRRNRQCCTSMERSNAGCNPQHEKRAADCCTGIFHYPHRNVRRLGRIRPGGEGHTTGKQLAPS